MKKVSCPKCKKKAEYSLTNPYRPFCSERCKILDLGDWAEETYSIPEKPTSFETHENSTAEEALLIDALENKDWLH